MANAELPMVDPRTRQAAFFPLAFSVLLGCLLGVGALAWGLLDPAFRDGEGYLTGQFVVPIAVAASLLLGVPLVIARQVSLAGWFSLALVGQAVALQLIDAGPALHFQHYRPLNVVAATQPLWLLVLGLQTVCVGIGIARRRSAIMDGLRATFAWWQLFGIGAVFVSTSAALSRDPLAYATELPLAAFIQLVSLGNVVLLAASLGGGALAALARGSRWVLGQAQAEAGARRGPDRLALAVAAWVVLLAAALNVLSYEQFPHIPDEVAYLIPARYMAAGMLTMPAPPVQAAFDVDLMTYEPTRWFSPVQPGWPAVLALGARLGVPWLIDPLLAGVNVLLSFVLVRELYDRRVARLGILLLAVSPWHVFMAMNFMTHTVSLTFALGAAVAVAWSSRTSQARWALLAGLLLGCGALVRQLDGLIAAVLVGLWAIGVGGRRLEWPSIAALIAGTAVVTGIWLPYNQLLSGDWRVFPLEAYIEQHYGKNSNALGFGPERGLGWPLQALPGHTPLNAIINTVLNAFSLNIELFGWATGSLVIVAVLVFSGAMRRRDVVLIGAIAIVVGTYGLYWYHGGPDFGPRYWYLILIPCIALAARGMEVLQARLARLERANRARVTAVVLVLSGLALLTYFPWRAVDKYHHYEFMRPDMATLDRTHAFGRSLVLVQGERHPDYMSAAIFNPLDLSADGPIYAWDRDPSVRDEVLRAYADRPVWLVDGPSLTQSGFHVIAGPLTASDLLAQAKAGP